MAHASKLAAQCKRYLLVCISADLSRGWQAPRLTLLLREPSAQACGRVCSRQSLDETAAEPSLDAHEQASLGINCFRVPSKEPATSVCPARSQQPSAKPQRAHLEISPLSFGSLCSALGGRGVVLQAHPQQLHPVLLGLDGGLSLTQVLLLGLQGEAAVELSGGRA